MNWNDEPQSLSLYGGLGSPCQFPQDAAQKASPLGGERRMPEFRTENNVCGEVVNAVACCVKVKIPDTLAHGLEDLLTRCGLAVERMLDHLDWSSSKYYSDLVPCVVSKSLIAKYQRNPKCQRVQNLVIPICGDKGKQIKIVDGGIRIPALFKKEVMAVDWPREIVGHVRSIELFRRNGKWFGSICYNTAKDPVAQCEGIIGVDRNSVGNIAVVADIQTGAVRKIGICPARTKFVFRHRRNNLARAGKTRLLKKLYRKQRRRMSYENHRATRAVVDYAATHRRAVVMENLENVRSGDSKIRGYSEKNQWAFAQFGSMLRYKCALRGVPLIEVDPAYTSQRCSRCGSIHRPNGKRFRCLTCGHNDHRDANAAFNIGLQSLVARPIGARSGRLRVRSLRPIGGPQAETIGASYAQQ
jgi:putative transposase